MSSAGAWYHHENADSDDNQNSMPPDDESIQKGTLSETADSALGDRNRCRYPWWASVGLTDR
jgi:hypothetical protein